MELAPYVEALRRELLTAAEVAGEEVRTAAERLLAALESSVRLVLIDALSTAAEDITAEMAPASVELRVRGRDPEFVVSMPPPREPPAPPPPSPPPSPPPFFEAEDGSRARISLRLPDELKLRIEEAAGGLGASVNSWLVHALNDAVSGTQQPPGDVRRDRQHGRRMSGWVR